MCNFYQLYHANKLHSEKKNTKSDDCILIVTNPEGEFKIYHIKVDWDKEYLHKHYEQKYDKTNKCQNFKTKTYYYIIYYSFSLYVLVVQSRHTKKKFEYLTNWRFFSNEYLNLSNGLKIFRKQ